MSYTLNLEELIQRRWDQSNAEGLIVYSAETLRTRTIIHQDIPLYLIYNSSRDVYDRSQKSIDRPAGAQSPFSDGSNPELARTEDQTFKILGNRFACVRHQSILVPIETQEIITLVFLKKTLHFSIQHPQLTLLYNAINAGKTVPYQYWLLSFQNYETLIHPPNLYKLEGKIHGISLYKRETPCYMIAFDISENIETVSEILFKLINFMEHKNFNMFVFSNRVYFIPRENLEIPAGFENHRFGGLEMIGYFVLKSAEAFESADPIDLIDGIHQISYKQAHQHHLEKYLLEDSN